MIAGLDWAAIAWALFALFGVSTIGGLVFGMGLSMDALRGIEDRDRLRGDQIDEKMDERLDAALLDRTTQIQLVALTFGAALVGGAVVALRAPAAPLANAAVVAGIAALANFIPLGGTVPRRVQVAGFVASALGVMGAAIVLS
ncbi:hypothetical protein [Maritimibacter sp. DP1N21-5]|uniref:hypothetical protein n=1 Tax=Maritimibacter sp. DP1N21-5 TaxID=2836867 RepID=UPI001C454205|nr:hypothetical protein [Maritimibacter sp. DP1N21-5]MBV7409917.1 hypothetical protein [Maritimibacter sp. DP1N21-5]